MDLPATLRSPLRHAGVAALAGLVLLLGILARAPSAHAWLHGLTDAAAHCATVESGGEHPGHADHTDTPETELGCAVTLFAQGLPLALSAPRALPPLPAPQLATLAVPSAQLPETPARLHPPAHAPPAGPV